MAGQQESAVRFETPNLVGVAKPRILVVEIGQTCTSVVRGDERIDQRTIIRYPTPKDYNTLIGNIEEISSVLFSDKRPNAIGIGIDGQLNSNGFITDARGLGNYIGQPIIQDLGEATDVPVGNIACVKDMVAAARAEQIMRTQGDVEITMEGIYRLDAHLDGVRFDTMNTVLDEPGHEFLRAGASCSCGSDGCLEAHVSGSGIQRKFNLPTQAMPNDTDQREEIGKDLVAGFNDMLDRYYRTDLDVPARLAFFGSLALNNPYLLDTLHSGLSDIRGPETPGVAPAYYGNNSVLYGAYFVASDSLAAY